MLALDEMALQMQDKFSYRPDPSSPYSPIDLSEIKVTNRLKLDPQNDLAHEASMSTTPNSNTPKTIQLIGTDLNAEWESDSPLPTTNWKLSGGVLTRQGEGPSLISKNKYKDFDFHIEFLLPPQAASGIFLRGRYEVQLLDQFYRSPDGKPVASLGNHGAIYGSIAPTEIVYLGPNQWNTMDVRLIARNVTVVLNGKSVITNQRITVISPVALDREEETPGPIMIQFSKIDPSDISVDLVEFSAKENHRARQRTIPADFGAFIPLASYKC